MHSRHKHNYSSKYTSKQYVFTSVIFSFLFRIYMPKRSKRNRSKRRTHAKRRSRAQRRTRARRGGVAPTAYPIPNDIKYELWTEMMRDYEGNPRLDEADAMLENMMYEPNYIGQFSGKTFEGREDKEYWQGLDKIQAFFKYST